MRSGTGWTKRAGFCVGICLLLGACTNPWAEHAPDADAIALSGWAEDDARVVPLSVYCYRTLAVPDCHAHPVDDGGTRLVGAEGAPLTTYPSVE